MGSGHCYDCFECIIVLWAPLFFPEYMNIGYHFPSVIQFHRQLHFMVPEPNFKLGHGFEAKWWVKDVNSLACIDTSLFMQVRKVLSAAKDGVEEGHAPSE